MRKVILAVLISLCSVYSLAQGGANKLNPLEVRPEIAAKYAIYAMLSSNAYHKSDRVKFPVEMLGWIQIDLTGNPTKQPTKVRRSGLAYDIFEKQNTNEVIFAFRGTDSKKDYLNANFAIPPFSIQYAQANNEFEDYIKTHPDKLITVTGHSLGGGLALSISVRHGFNAVVFDSSPRVFDGSRDINLAATRIQVYEGGEILGVARHFWKKKFNKIVPPENTYKASFDFGKTDSLTRLAEAGLKHRSDYLATGLLRLGATVDDKLTPLLANLPK